MGNRRENSGNSVILPFFFGGGGGGHCKITTDGDFSHEIKRHLLFGKKVMNNQDSIFKSRNITLPKKDRLLKAMVCPVVMYRCKSCAVK